METTCAKCSAPLDLNKVHYNKKVYCHRCMDQIDETYLEKMRQFRLDVRSGKIITHES